MTRYRPPSPTASRFITAEGHARLRAELGQLWRTERPQVTQAVSEAAAQGDRSENADYTYGKRRLREIDRRVRFLRQRLEGMLVVANTPSDARKVFFGAWVTVEYENARQACYRIVGPDEFDMAHDYISMDAPLARALLRRSLDDEVEVELPGGKQRCAIVAIHYGARPATRARS